MSNGTEAPANGAGGFYFWAGVIATTMIVTGFAKTFYLKGLFNGPALSALLWAHGLVMTIWLGLFIAQTGLVASGRTDLHRRLGIFGALWAAVVVVVGFLTAVDAARRGASPAPDITPLMFMAIPFFDAAVFGALVALAVWFRRKAAIHKRLMLLATLSILAPGVARLPFDVIQQGGMPLVLVLTLAPAVVCAAIDTFRNRRLHPAFGWGTVFVIASWPARLMLAGTAGWTTIASRLVG